MSHFNTLNMKTIKLIIPLFLSVLIMNSCCGEPDPKIWEYQPVEFAFLDASGNDLVKKVLEPFLDYDADESLKLYNDSYTLKVIYPQPCMDPEEAYLTGMRRADAYPDDFNNHYFTPRLYGYIDQDVWNLCFVPETSDRCDKAKMLTLKIISPVFGDEQEHEFLLHFDGLKVSRILMDGKEYSFEEQKRKDFIFTKRIIYKPEDVVVAFTTIIL